MTNEMLESNMRDSGLYLLMFFSTMAGVALSMLVLRQFPSFTSTLPADLFVEAAAFGSFMGGFFLFLWKETILTLGTKRRIWIVILDGFIGGIITTSVRYLFEAMLRA